jgi:hypothetical protein
MEKTTAWSQKPRLSSLYENLLVNRTHRVQAWPLLFRQVGRGLLVGVLVGRLRVPVGLLAMFVGGGGVVLGLVMFAGGMVVGRLVVVMSCGMVVSGRIMMVLGGGMLVLFGHDWSPG